MNALPRIFSIPASHVPLEVAEGVGAPLGPLAGLVLELLRELVVGERLHAAVGVVDEHDLLGPEQALRDDQAPQGVLGGDSVGVAYDVGVALFEAQDVCQRGSSRTTSMQASTATFLAGGSARSPLSKVAA